MLQRQAAGFSTVASVFKPGTRRCQPCSHRAAGATGKGLACRRGGGVTGTELILAAAAGSGAVVGWSMATASAPVAPEVERGPADV